MSKFNEGDKVRVVRKVEGDYGDDGCLYWSDEDMDPYVNDGEVYMVERPDWFGGVGLEGSGAAWPEDALELASE